MELEELRNDVAHIKEKVNKLLMALVGDDITKNGGLVQRVIDTESSLVELSDKINVIGRKSAKTALYVKIMWGTAGAIGMAIFTLLIKR